MSKPIGQVTITLNDGVDRDFIFTMGTLRRLNKAPGESIEDVRLEDLIWAGLSKNDRNLLSVEDVADLIPLQEESIQLLTQQIFAGLPKAPENPPPAQPLN